MATPSTTFHRFNSGISHHDPTTNPYFDAFSKSDASTQSHPNPPANLDTSISQASTILHHRSSCSSRPSNHPTHILLFMHLTAQPHQITKYTSVLSTLYPQSQIHTFTCSIAEFLFLPISVYQAGHLTSKEETRQLLHTPPSELRMLTFAFSLAGAYQMSALAKLYRDVNGTPFPVKMTVFDCAPALISKGTIVRVMSKSAYLYSAGPNGLKKLLQFLVGVFTTIYLFSFTLLGRKDNATLVCEMCNDPKLFGLEGKRVYMYTNADEWIPEAEIMREIDAAERKGWEVRRERFVGCRHNRCVLKDGQRYWVIVKELWEMSGKAVGRDGQVEKMEEAESVKV
ncbi:MAG: hypothetical protein Q9166_000386 [cf. Caloplaca sp. 2 TL-2023]